jgi:hypothetical protein
MPTFYQSLDVLVCPSLVEGGPMPVLETLACGVPVVVPEGVGIIDELPRIDGIYRYERGNATSLVAALQKAIESAPPDAESLRACVMGYSVESFCQAHQVAFEQMMDVKLDAGIRAEATEQLVVVSEKEDVIECNPPVEYGTGSARGIYIVAFGDQARTCASRLMNGIRTHMPDIPIALCSDRKIGSEDVLIIQPDSDVGGRRAKLKAYELSPAEWRAVLYLDADTEVVAPIYRFFEWIEDGWEFVICKDPHLMDTLHAFERSNNKRETLETEKIFHTKHILSLNGGVWAFGRNERVAAFFSRWRTEWERYGQRDQGALLRALYATPLKTLVLGNEWNTFPKYSKGVTTAGLMHYPGQARRWRGIIPGRIDSPQAWAMVRESKYGE